MREENEGALELKFSFICNNLVFEIGVAVMIAIRIALISLGIISAPLFA